MKTWHRVIDPLNPLYGYDVRLGHGMSYLGDRSFYAIDAIRRIDMVVGDRPFQLVAEEGSDLGLMLSVDVLGVSLVQDEVIEIETSRPHGRCLDESSMTRKDGHTLRIARYERALQVALDDPQEQLLATKTYFDKLDEMESSIIQMFVAVDDPETLTFVLQRRD